MKFNFHTYELKEGSKQYNNIVTRYKKPNEFIVVGEEKIGDIDCYKAQ